MTEPIDQATKVMSNTDGEDTQKVSLGELLLNAGTRIVDLEKQSNDQVEIITHLEKQLASLREQIAKKDEDAIQAIDAMTKQIAELMHQLKQKDLEAKYWLTQSKTLQSDLKQKEDENRELWNKAIDKCIVIIRNSVKTGFPHYHIASVLQTLKRKENEPEFTHPDETED